MNINQRTFIDWRHYKDASTSTQHICAFKKQLPNKNQTTDIQLNNLKIAFKNVLK
jgi:hypothetical protein